MFSDQPQPLMDDIAQHQELLLGYYHHERLGPLKTITRPIQAWYVTSTGASGVNTGSLNFSGSATRGVGANASMGAGAGANISTPQISPDAVDDPTKGSPTGCLDRFASCYTSSLYNVLIVADNKALTGKDLHLVADDMVMLALSQSRSPDGCNALPSVIDAFAKSACPGRDPPAGLTAADSAYLSALYASDAKAKKATMLSEMGSRMAKILVKAKADAAGAAR